MLAETHSEGGMAWLLVSPKSLNVVDHNALWHPKQVVCCAMEAFFGTKKSVTKQRKIEDFFVRLCTIWDAKQQMCAYLLARLMTISVGASIGHVK
jgi:hypothetical protein